MKKKIMLIVCYGLIALFVGAIIALAIIPKNYLMKIENPDKITIENITEKQSAFYNVSQENFNKEDYDKLVSEFRNAFQQSIITSLFTGNLGAKQTITAVSSVTKPSSGLEVKLEYFENQNVYVNGQLYKDPNFTSRQVQTKCLRFFFENDSDFTNVSVYIIDSTQAEEEYYKVQTLASSKNLFELTNELLNIED